MRWGLENGRKDEYSKIQKFKKKDRPPFRLLCGLPIVSVKSVFLAQTESLPPRGKTSKILQ